jgi:hypothetical protein
LRADNITLRAIIESTATAVVVEDYPDAFKGPTVLPLHIINEKVVHVVWGIGKSEPEMATLVTAYIPDLKKWYDGFLQRRPK